MAMSSSRAARDSSLRVRSLRISALLRFMLLSSFFRSASPAEVESMPYVSSGFAPQEVRVGAGGSTCMPTWACGRQIQLSQLLPTLQCLCCLDNLQSSVLQGRAVIGNVALGCCSGSGSGGGAGQAAQRRLAAAAVAFLDSLERWGLVDILLQVPHYAPPLP